MGEEWIFINGHLFTHWIISLSRWPWTQSTLGWFHTNETVFFKGFHWSFLRCMYGCFTWGTLTLHSSSSNLTKSDYLSARPFVCVAETRFFVQESKPKLQPNVPLRHPYWIFMCIKLLRRRKGVCSCLNVAANPTFSPSLYLFAFIVIVPD